MILSEDITTDDSMCARIAGQHARAAIEQQRDLGAAYAACVRERRAVPPWLFDLSAELARGVMAALVAWGHMPEFRAALRGN